MKKLSIGSCFSGIGGLELGLEWTGGFETKWQIEMDEYATRVLEKHWPNVKRYSDIRDVVRPDSVDLICGGFPCQDVSLAGKRAGLEGKRSTLWGEMFRLVCEIRPKWVVAENVPGLLSSDNGQFFGNILRDLAGAGYDAEWGVLSASGVGAPHLRRRVFILANAKGERSESGCERQRGICEKGNNIYEPSGSSKDFSNSESKQVVRKGSERLLPKSSQCSWWESEPDVGRVANGIPLRVDRLKCLGNAVVPQVAQKIGEMILRKEVKNG